MRVFCLVSLTALICGCLAPGEVVESTASTTTSSTLYVNAFAEGVDVSVLANVSSVDDLGNSDFYLVCPEPCSLNITYLTQSFNSFSRVCGELKALTGVEVVEGLSPVEVHLEEDEQCPRSYPSGYYWYTSDGRGKLCLFGADKDALFAHEMTHLLFKKRVDTYYVLEEGFCKAVEYRVRGRADSLCDDVFDTGGEDAAARALGFVHGLCVNHSLDYGDLDQFFMALDAESREKKRPLKTSELKEVLDRVACEDTQSAFNGAGIPVG